MNTTDLTTALADLLHRFGRIYCDEVRQATDILEAMGCRTDQLHPSCLEIVACQLADSVIATASSDPSGASAAIDSMLSGVARILFFMSADNPETFAGKIKTAIAFINETATDILPVDHAPVPTRSGFNARMMDMVTTEIAATQGDARQLEAMISSLLAATAVTITIVSGANKDVIDANVTTSAGNLRDAALATADEILASTSRPTWVSP